jgi:hypothetical protein
VQEWNLDIEQSLSSNTMLTLGYIGNVTRHQSARADLNQPYALSPRKYHRHPRSETEYRSRNHGWSAERPLREL